MNEDLNWFRKRFESKDVKFTSGQIYNMYLYFFDEVNKLSDLPRKARPPRYRYLAKMQKKMYGAYCGREREELD